MADRRGARWCAVIPVVGLRLPGCLDTIDIGENYHTPQAAARAYDRGVIAIRGLARVPPDALNFPKDTYAQQVCPQAASFGGGVLQCALHFPGNSVCTSLNDV